MRNDRECAGIKQKARPQMLKIHLDANGCDATGDGSPRRPVGTLQRAVELSRAAEPGARRRIVAGEGIYFDTEAVVTAADSGLELVAKSDAEPVFLGGRRVGPWRAEGGGSVFWTAEIDPGWEFRALAVNGRFATRARFPEEGSIEHASAFPVRWMSTTGGGWERKPTEEELTTMRLLPNSLPETISERNAELTIYHCWDESLVGIKYWDRAHDMIVFSTPSGHPPGAFGESKRQARSFVVWNVREGMTKPGQWYQDREAGRIVYWPLEGETLADMEAFAPTRAAVLRVNGTAEAPVNNVRIKGVTFGLTTTPLIAGGFGARLFEGAIEGVNVRGLRLEDTTILWAGGQGARLSNCHGLRCLRCDFHDTGAGGASFDGTDGVVEDTLIHHVGLSYSSAIGLRLGGERWRVRHNTIHNTPYSAIAAGGKDLRFERNRFHHVMEQLMDGAAIYMFAADSCVLRGNYTHDIRDSVAHAYYLDERSVDSLVEGNVAENVPWALHNHMGSNCVIRNNVCLSSSGMKLTLALCDRFVLERNVLVCEGEFTFNGAATSIACLRGNCFFSRSGNYNWSFNDMTPSRQRDPGPMPMLPRSQGSLLADPGCRCDNGRISYLDKDLAARLKLPCLDVSSAGRRIGGPHGKNRAKA